jgi:exopolyphosphatase/pppGpp-phosphohydrolase
LKIQQVQDEKLLEIAEDRAHTLPETCLVLQMTAKVLQLYRRVLV